MILLQHMDLHRLRLLGSLHKAKNHHQHRVLKLTIEPLRNGPDPAQIREPRQQPGKGRSGIKSLVASGSKSERSNSRLPSLCCVGWTMLHPSRSRPTASTGQATCHLPYVALHDPRFGVSLHCAHADPFHNLDWMQPHAKFRGSVWTRWTSHPEKIFV
jgi:hypothetical protein